MKKSFDGIKQLSRRLGKGQIKQQLIDSLGYYENIDKEELSMCADRAQDYHQKGLNIIKEYEDIKIKKTYVLLTNMVRFLNNLKRKFKSFAEQFKITKSTSKNDDIINNIELFKKVLQRQRISARKTKIILVKPVF